MANDTKDIRAVLLEQRAKLIESLGMFVIKTLITLNAGAIVVLMTLLGSMAAKDTHMTVDIDVLRSAVTWFLIGIGTVFVICAEVYIIAQLRLSLALRPSGPAKARPFLSRVYLASMILLPCASFASFCAGFLRAASAFS